MTRERLEKKFETYNRHIDQDFTSTLNEIINDLRPDLNHQGYEGFPMEEDLEEVLPSKTNDLKIGTSDFMNKTPHLYYFNESTKGYIYSKDSFDDIVGLTGTIQHKVVQIDRQKNYGKKRMSLVSMNGEEIGWIHMKSSARAYRLPNIQGKYLNEGYHPGKNSEVEDRIIKAKFIYFKPEPHLLVSRMDSNELISIRAASFHRILTPTMKEHVYLKKGTGLYRDSQLMDSFGEIAESSNYRVLSFFEKLGEVRVSVDGKPLWTKVDKKLFYDSEVPKEELDYELMDYIIHLKEQSQNYKETIDEMQSRLRMYEAALEVPFNGEV